MEASGGAHYWARELTKLGHTVKLMSPQFVRPYVQRQKNDANDAAGMCEAVGRPQMRFVPIRACFKNQTMLLAKRLTISRIIASCSSVSLVCTWRS
jgi:transposase